MPVPDYLSPVCEGSMNFEPDKGDEFNMGVMTLNTTFRIEPHNGRTDAMHMHNLNIIFAGFQDTRNSADSKALHGYHKFMTESVLGGEGCGLWCNIDQPYAKVG
eukprot:6427153-Karenia_brevis.AAC.1